MNPLKVLIACCRVSNQNLGVGGAGGEPPQGIDRLLQG